MDQLAVPLDALDRSQLEAAGGKAVNLGELLRARLPVPPGFCLTTAAYARAAAAAGIDALLDQVASAPAEELAALAAEIRGRLEGVELDPDTRQSVHAAVREFGEAVPLAVRSSATAEDLPFASFAGQQETYLNIVGADAVEDAVRRCWGSLWTDRAVVYRHNQKIDQRTVRLAVVIQRMVDAAVAGVLFTANPLTGRRGQGVVEAAPGLGEAVVSGAVNPDHWTIDLSTGKVLDGPRDGSLSEAQLQTLAHLGQQVEALFGAPQDIEFAFDRAGTAWLVQARSITTLYPLPASAPRDQRELRVYLSFNVAQGVFRPITPMGIDAFRVLSIALAGAVGVRRTTAVLVEAGLRLFVDLTPALRSPFGRRIIRTALGQGEARSAAVIDQVLVDPRLAPRRVSRLNALKPLARAMWRTRIPAHLVAALIDPRRARTTVARMRRAVEAAGQVPASASAQTRVDAAEQLLSVWPPPILPRLVPLLLGGLGSFALAERLLGDLASADERDAVRRALPNNPTTEMDLDLWALSRAVRSDAASRAALQQRSASDLASAYAARALPDVLQRGLSAFLARYGHRAVAEIDIGVPRWSDDPAPVLANLANYLTIEDGPRAPEIQFQNAAHEAEQTVDELARRAARRGRLRGLAVRFLLRRGRALAGFREMPKFLVVVLLARSRALLLTVGTELAGAGRLDAADDVFFLTFDEVRQAIGGTDVRAWVEERRARYAEKLRRRHVPRLLLSDGTEPTPPVDDGLEANVLRGTPASAGRVTGRARVILEPSGAKLEPGDILVAPSTDPGWTPLFLSAAGLVMEMGGAMSHGAVVAREYGIPAVVGVPGASERVADGQQITVDGSQGTVTLSS